MSSIDSSSSSSDRSAQTDEARRVRETYQQREADNAKKQGQQIKRLTEAHAADPNWRVAGVSYIDCTLPGRPSAAVFPAHPG